MKKHFAIMAVMLAALTACEKPMLDTESAVTNPCEPTTVTLQFSPYDMQAMTRSGSISIASISTRLDIWLYSAGQEVQAIHQTKDDDGFGTLTVTLDKTKTYTLYAVAHKSTEPATLQDGILAFPGPKITQTLYYSETFSPATKQALSCLMERIVGMFTMQTTDLVPDDCATMTFTVEEMLTRWNVAGYGLTPEERTITFSPFNKDPEGTASFSVYIIADPDESIPHTITATALDADGQTLQTRTFQDVPIRNGYKTIYRGAYFTDTAETMTFKVEDWNSFEVTEF